MFHSLRVVFTCFCPKTTAFTLHIELNTAARFVIRAAEFVSEFTDKYEKPKFDENENLV